MRPMDHAPAEPMYILKSPQQNMKEQLGFDGKRYSLNYQIIICSTYPWLGVLERDSTDKSVPVERHLSLCT